MNLFDRFILTLYSLALTIVSVVVMAVTVQIVPYRLVLENLQAVYSVGNIRYTYFTVAFIFFLISLKFLFQGFRVRGKRDSKTGKAAIAQNTEIGQVRISTNTLDSIILKATRRVRGVREAKSTVTTDETGTTILLQVAVDGETSIPTIVEETQKNVKEQVEKIVGIEVRQIDVKITEVAQQASTRLSRVE
ncbi:hypothetical protein BEP19_01140 [Ammoniphilus oxalaticus]|uniref:Alkaline shock response membrane anchor protein AmaP n=1 Tax=Ammoniphilus oxalaticus TaxID=66863 RepID=A0A419SMY7_9BACL|nr:alkaline shock response membrane anchor protein AmaP [Ammoniphilus oxalaticus]RKD25579.1 hypothetical protein BEP19_01140 [Ammoniphilus oxalaticus]